MKKEEKIRIAPSILSCDFSKLGEEITQLINAGADYIHFDVMDGHFVPNITIGPPIVASLRRYCSVPMDVHLMIDNPEEYIETFADAGADIITIHIEATNHPHRLINQIRDLGCKAGIVLNPATPESRIEFLVEDIDMVLVMTVNPGFGGQKFIPDMLRKIKSIRAMIGDKDLEVDGGIDQYTAGEVIKAGANILVAGSYVFSNSSYKTAIKNLKESVNFI
ncbi:MAG TPA: ribulose-phosphate 3-epimerase [Candidatus Hydrogenedens sp.]|nr:ribulose-phosphate 3-epimerase [Candidatus Hydrogenedens sp.]HOL20608.1 ribulose-phosphate 3-epimerase [Candidatus Hydrogenedens sp.]HPP59452.1 ribulose-phosphate 3-epimerase [Candidatus Hydrogenedens sp.]